jgi:hypothetical protein
MWIIFGKGQTFGKGIPKILPRLRLIAVEDGNLCLTLDLNYGGNFG